MRFSTVLGCAILLAGSTMADAPAPTPAAAHFEVTFLTDMIDHHMMAVHMSKMCVERAAHSELKDLCQNIITSQTEEIHHMDEWLQDWYGITYEHEMHMTGEMKRLMSMTGTTFEIEFMQMMIRHHHKAVIEARQCQRKAYHPELIKMCHHMEMVQAREIELMRMWLCSWYGICNWGPKV